MDIPAWMVDGGPLRRPVLVERREARPPRQRSQPLASVPLFAVEMNRTVFSGQQMHRAGVRVIGENKRRTGAGGDRGGAEGGGPSVSVVVPVLPQAARGLSIRAGKYGRFAHTDNLLGFPSLGTDAESLVTRWGIYAVRINAERTQVAQHGRAG